MIALHFAVSLSVEKSGSTWFWGFGEFNPWDPAALGFNPFAAALHWSPTIVVDPLMNHWPYECFNVGASSWLIFLLLGLLDDKNVAVGDWELSW